MSDPTIDASTPATDEILIRPLTAADWPGAKALDAAAFGYDTDDDFLDTVSLPALDIGRFLGAFDPALDGQLVGTCAIQSRELTFPGHGPAPVAAVTWVSVRPDQQRRGILRRLMKRQLHGLHEDQREPVAILTASEAVIYGRFGYGLASLRTRLEVPAPAPFRPDVTTEPVLEVPQDQALPRVRELHASIAPTFPGFLDRSPEVWATLFSDHPFASRGVNRRRFALHPDGYVVFRLSENWTDRGPDHTLTISELAASTPVARASLWRHVLNYPLVRTVVFPRAWVDEPLLHLLANPRTLSADSSDNVWVRIVDLPRAVDLRTYSSPAAVTARVVDRFCPWNDGVWRLQLTGAGGRAQRSDDAPELQLDISDLGAAFLGGTGIAALAIAGRVTGSPGAIGALDLALRGSLAPWTPEGF
jgi:predicted acetyltransferase